MKNMPAGKFTGCTTISNSELLSHNSGLENQKDDVLSKAKKQEPEELQYYTQICPKNCQDKSSELSVPLSLLKIITMKRGKYPSAPTWHILG